MMKHLFKAIILILVVNLIHISLNPPKVTVKSPVKPVRAVSKPINKEAVVEPTPEPKEPTIDLEAQAKAFIYHVESGNNPNAVNPYGCRGLGQACPGTKLPCGNDYACQDQWFTNYMIQRYGSWQKAKAFWVARVPINGRDVGNWW